ncbi:DNA-cytosine methyltransferase [Xenorhabdus bovienii str. kraussei Quebec]|uniref:DNA (cytosine-5-)-methyltransferase n=1 Tax=Xenorhabdus bovienii str. kraussei Quebec TaxID=1398203 RepID=A0A077PFB3_XENBV|nr:DNA cytosine methyltransferase [Xenorhabdus bovienii]CDH18349.1 DNA-cytosine methyltransferase [Xenorhabdus bovienii str. kraussei Quebec]
MKKENKFNHIELFSGCGGLSLGLEKAGFELLLANELSPMAAETFSYNFFNENYQLIAKKNKKPKHSFWISSKHEKLLPRLRENPFEYPEYAGKDSVSDLPINFKSLKGNLLIGNIIELNKLIESKPELLQELQSGFSNDGVHLVSGGPPCQGFSMAGLREKDSDKNMLPWEFAKFVEHVQPKIAVLENVTGILRAFKDSNGMPFYAWFEVAKAFAEKKYVPLCLHVNARFAGVPQNRPRFIMIAIRSDIFAEIRNSFDIEGVDYKLLSSSMNFYQLVQNEPEKAIFGTLECYDSVKNVSLFEESFLHHLIGHRQVSVKDALDDLKQTDSTKPSKFVEALNDTFSTVLLKQDGLSNHEHRSNGYHVKRRFRLYQVVQESQSALVKKEIFDILKGSSCSLSDAVWGKIKDCEFLKDNNKIERFDSKESFIEYLQDHPTKKHSQKALDANLPAPAALSIPDDACHYDKNELRVLTVREMARIQSFPDDFVFRSKVTTGGQMRKFEVPQYTQVGNAVPPLLGLAIGKVITELLTQLTKKR